MGGVLNAAGFTSQNDNWTVNTNTITGVGGTADGIYVAVPPRCIAVREQFVRVYGKKLGEVSRGQYQGVKARDRNRDVPLSSAAVELLRRVMAESKWKGPNDPVFAA